MKSIKKSFHNLSTNWLLKNALSKCAIVSVICSILITLAGCALNPVTGQSEMALVSIDQEIEIGNEVFAKMQKSEGGVYSKYPKVNAYVATVGQKLAKVSERSDLPFEFVVLDNAEPNAWTLPGGKIAINRGLLLELKSEAELAAVLAHEIVHAVARHGAQNIEREMIATVGILAAQEMVQESKHKELIGATTLIGSQLIMLRYNRKAELEADRYGMIYMARAGYNPQAAIDLQKMFLSLAKQKKTNWLQGLFLSHPPTEERVQANVKTAKELPQSGIIGSEEYQKVMATLKKASLT